MCIQDTEVLHTYPYQTLKESRFLNMIQAGSYRFECVHLMNDLCKQQCFEQIPNYTRELSILLFITM